MALATALCRESLARSKRVHSSSAATSGALLERRAASRSSAVTPLISRSMSKMASMRLTASSAIGEIGAAFLPSPRVGGDVGEFEELASGVAPT